MASILIEADRDIVPRWRDFSTTVAIGELKSSATVVSPISISPVDHLAQKIRDWKINPSLAFAADLVNTAFVSGAYLKAAIDAADFIVSQTEGVPSPLRQIAELLLRKSESTDELADVAHNALTVESHQSLEPNFIYTQIRHLRMRLRDEPRNSISYVDLARWYTLLDQNEKAVRSMNLALAISPNNRFILRSAARLFLHVHDYKHAHRILRRAEITRFDSWLLAAEIGVASAANNPPRFVRTGQQMLKDANLHPSEITELAAAIAMQEIDSGKNREARKLMEKALVAPTENSLAQIGWASRHKSIQPSRAMHEFDNVPLVHESKAWEYYSKQDWRKALSESIRWFYDQPFSGRPVYLASYIASVILSDYESAISILRIGKTANPHNFLIGNNLAFSYASSDRPNDAKKILGDIDKSDLTSSDRVILTATEGLIAFRSGEIEAGREKYLQAIERAKSLQNERLLTRAYIFLAREELRAKTVNGVAMREIALERVRHANDPEQEIIARTQLGLA